MTVHYWTSPLTFLGCNRATGLDKPRHLTYAGVFKSSGSPRQAALFTVTLCSSFPSHTEGGGSVVGVR